MRDVAIRQIRRQKEAQPEVYEKVLKGLFGELNFGQVKELPERSLWELHVELKMAIATHESKYDIKKLKYAIQSSRSGIGGCAMTMFTCAFCGKEEMWGNTAVPNICGGCAEDMATKIVTQGMKIEK